MPIYEHKCNGCGNTFEFLSLSHDNPETVTCPSCGSSKTEKQVSKFSTLSSSASGLRTASRGLSCGSPGGFS